VGVAEDLRGALDVDGFVVRRSVASADLVLRLRNDVEAALAAEAADFPPGHQQHGRVLFAPAYGGSFTDLLADEAVLSPVDELLTPECTAYTMTTSCLSPGVDGPISVYHRDFDPDRSDVRLAIVAMLLLDPFTDRSGATEILAGSHLDRHGVNAPGRSNEPVAVFGDPGDVCYFDARVLHRSARNRTHAPRRAVMVMMVPPWIAPRVDIRSWLGDERLAALPDTAARRLGVRAFPPRSIEEFVTRGTQRAASTEDQPSEC
jgi:ectoine hydroxylase-related dioxygenase (phytanoyl-CoA dioxygenase family)